jgi:hypothetical protein
MLMRTYDMQLANEHRFARAHIDKYMRDYVRNDVEVAPLLAKGVRLINEYMWKEYDYTSKNLRVQSIREMDVEELVFEIIVASAYCQYEEMLSSFCAKLAGVLKMSDKVASIQTISEMVAVLADTDLYDLIKNDKFDSWHIQSNIELSHKLEQFMINCTYLPPLVHPPEPLEDNRSSAYFTIKNDSVILNKGHHDGDVCLDVLDRMNGVPLALNIEFLCRVEEEPYKDMSAVDKQNSWLSMKGQSHEHYKLMVSQGNRFYLGHKYDRRGRAYAQGYHISTQGSPYKKAMLDFADKELVNGVPQEFML